MERKVEETVETKKEQKVSIYNIGMERGGAILEGTRGEHWSYQSLI